MKMRFWVKVGLFISSYFPLFLILAVKNWFNCYMTSILIIVGIYSLVWVGVISISKKGTVDSYKVLKVENETQKSLNYLIPYIISFIGFDLNKWQDWGALTILLAILFVVYLNSDLLYVNPMLLFFKYKIYKIEVCKPIIGCEDTRSEILIITNRKNYIRRDERITVKDIDRGIVLEAIE